MEKLRKALSAVADNCYHFYPSSVTDTPYVIWKEDGRNDLRAGNVHAEKAWTGVVDLYTKTENDPLVHSIEGAFESIGCAYNLVTVDYEEETGKIHYSWDWELPDGDDSV